MEKQKSTQLMLNYGVIQGLLMVVFAVALYALDVQFQAGIFSFIFSAAVSVAILVMVYKQFKLANDGFMSLGEAIKIGMGIALIAAIISLIYQFIYQQFIDPNYIERLLEYQQQQMVENNPEMTQEQIEMASEMTRKFSSVWITSAIILIAGLFFGLIYSLIVGSIMKKERPANF